MRSLAKTMNANRTDFSQKIVDALRVYRTIYKKPISMPSYQLIFGMSFNLPVELEHKALWALKALEWKKDSKDRIEQLNDLDKFRFKAYGSSFLFKDKMKKQHDAKILRREFKVGDRVLL
ncbi:uncharacterized protein LOC107030105 [Solanum pennellii]|uniref:Uncharacterized protein LOC107030105 n=1 Tax=Solanum pennellii TaxID=28526 RepID=A0ABM1HKY2_SOLPN|nr:uncharacterized protein LOC107030105 [Solanum pennellii]